MRLSYGSLFSSALVALALTGAVQAQTIAKTDGVLVVVPAYGEVRQENDEAHATLMIEEQDRDKAVAASRVNQKMRQGTEIIRREDPQAKLSTRGYYSYPVYADQPQSPSGRERQRQPVSWRVGQTLDVTTSSLDRLPNTIAAAQSLLGLQGLSFRLKESSLRKLEEERIAAAYRNLSNKIAAIAKAMGKSPSAAELESMEFDGNGGEPRFEMPSVRSMRAAAEPAPVEVPSFEPGETTLSTRLLGKVRFK